MNFPNTRYIFDPQPDTASLNDILRAMVAIYPPLYSLDVIPERLRYMFREEGLSKAEVPAAHFKLALSADAVNADDLGWIDTFKTTAPAGDEATEFSQSDLIIESAIGRMIAERCGLRISGLDERRILTAIRRGEATGLTTTVEAQEALTAAHAWADAEIKRLHVECDNFKAEVERLSNGYHEPCIARAEGLEAALKKSKAEVERLRAEMVKWHETHPPSICFSHDRVQLDCPICNPALAMLKTAMEERDALRLKYGEF